MLRLLKLLRLTLIRRKIIVSVSIWQLGIHRLMGEIATSSKRRLFGSAEQVRTIEETRSSHLNNGDSETVYVNKASL